MGELIEFGRGKHLPKKEEKLDQDRENDTAPQSGAYDDPNDEPLFDEDERRVQSQVSAVFRENGLDTQHYKTTTGLLKTLVAQISPERKNRLRGTFITTVHDYTMQQTIDFLNSATEHDLSVRPMFYDALCWKLDHTRIALLRNLRQRVRERHGNPEV